MWNRDSGPPVSWSSVRRAFRRRLVRRMRMRRQRRWRSVAFEGAATGGYGLYDALRVSTVGLRHRYKLADAYMQLVFERYGEIASIEVARDESSAVVRYLDEASAISAWSILDEADLPGYPGG